MSTSVRFTYGDRTRISREGGGIHLHHRGMLNTPNENSMDTKTKEDSVRDLKKKSVNRCAPLLNEHY